MSCTTNHREQFVSWTNAILICFIAKAIEIVWIETFRKTQNLRLSEILTKISWTLAKKADQMLLDPFEFSTGTNNQPTGFASEHFPWTADYVSRDSLATGASFLDSSLPGMMEKCREQWARYLPLPPNFLLRACTTPNATNSQRGSLLHIPRFLSVVPAS